MAISTPKNFDQSTRNDPGIVRIDPRQLKMENVFKGRWEPSEIDTKPVDDQYIEELAMNMIANGQEQPIVIRPTGGRGETRTFAPVFGFNRTRAAIRINEDEALRSLAEEYGRLNKNDLFLLDAIIRTMNKDEAIVHNIVENRIRKATSPIDDAHNAMKLRNMGKTNAEIARIMGISPAGVSQVFLLVELEEQHQSKVHHGELTVAAALNLLTLSEDDRESVFSELEAEEEAAQTAEVSTSEETSTEDVTAAAVAETSDSKDNDADAPKAETKKASSPEAKAKKETRKATPKAKVAKKIREKQRESGISVKPTMKEIKGVLVTAIDQSANHGVEDALVKHIFRSMLEYINGDASADEMLTAVAESLNN